MGYKIAKEQYEPLPSCYSQELANLVTAMLLKNDQSRPSMNEILASDIVQKHMIMLIKASCAPVKKSTVGPFELQATATAASEGKRTKDKRSLVIKVAPMSARESLRQKKEAENKKKFEEIKLATKAAHIQIAMYDSYDVLVHTLIII